MLPLLQAGLTAAWRQLGAVLIGILFVSLLAPYGFIVQDVSTIHSGAESCWISVSPFLIWAYLLVATALALTGGHLLKLSSSSPDDSGWTSTLDR